MSFYIFNKSVFGLLGSIYYKYYFHDINSPLIVTFAPDGELKNSSVAKGEDPWGFSFLKRNNYNVLSFCSIENQSNYYRDSDFINSLHEVSSTLPDFIERIGYGGSMGGYAVSAFANVLGLERILLINPISTRRLDIATWDYEAGRSLHTFGYDWGGPYADGADADASGFVIYDPLYDLDRKHAVRFKNLRPLKVHGVGHGVPNHLQAMNMLSWIVIAFIENKLSEKDFYHRIRARRLIKRYYDWLLSPQNKHLTAQRAHIINRYKLIMMKKVAHKEEGWEKYTDFYRAPKLPELNRIRNMAIMLEGIDIKLSYDLMSLALKHRPSGPFLRKKIQEYEEIIFDTTKSTDNSS